MNSHQRRIAKRKRQRRVFRYTNLPTSLAKLGLGSTLYRIGPDNKPYVLADTKPFNLGIDLASKPDMTAIQMMMHGNVYTLRTRSTADEISDQLKPGCIVNLKVGDDDRGANYRIVGKTTTPDNEELSISFQLERVIDEQSPKKD